MNGDNSNDQQWTVLPGVTSIQFESTHLHPDVMALLRGPEKPAQTHTVQVDYRVPVKLRWWRRAWLLARRKPHLTYPASLILPNASATVTTPEADQ